MNAQDLITTAGLAAALQVAGADITYRRGTTELSAVALIGTWADETTELDPAAPTLAHDSVDFILPLDQLATLDPAEPAPGDSVDYLGERHVLIDPPGRRSWSYVDNAGTWARIHTTRRGVFGT